MTVEPLGSDRVVGDMAQYISVSAMVSGKLVDLLNMSQKDINIWDIAWGLKHLNRFTGQTPVPWSVLSHTGLCYMLLMQEQGQKVNPVDQLAVLLHDATEAYLGDVARPLKQTGMWDEYRKVEDALQTTIFQRFGIAASVTEETFALIKRYDNQALAIEFDRFFPTLRGSAYAPPYVYTQPNNPVLADATPVQFIEVVKYLAINCSTQDVQTLFAMPDTLLPYVGPAAQTAQQLRPLRQQAIPQVETHITEADALPTEAVSFDPRMDTGAIDNLRV